MFILEGTIGAGKSTFLKLLKEYIPSLNVKLEAVDNWQSQEHGQSLLGNFYQDPQRWAYTFENFTFISRMKDHAYQQKNHDSIIIERSIYSGHYVFARNSFETGLMSELEWNIYNEWFHFLLKDCNPPRGFIYLQVNPEIALERIKKRNRQAEVSLSLDYLLQLDKQHQRFLMHKESVIATIANVPVLIINCDEEFESDKIRLKEHIEHIKQFIQYY